MVSRIRRILWDGLRQFREHPQLWLTIAVASAILLSFVYIANRFASVAKNAQEELINVRVGAIHDAFVPFAVVFIDEPPVLRGYMRRIAAQNPTITSFVVVQQKDDLWYITASLLEKEMNTNLLGYDFLLSLAKADPTNSFTIEETGGGERFFRTARAIVDEDSGVVAITVTRQTLSQADRVLAASMRSSVVVLVLVLLFLLLLFFHHARIIDYTVLYRKLSEVDKLKDDFLSMASHELRTPLTIIRGHAETLASGEHTKENARALELIDSSAKELDHLISDMLDVSSIESGGMKFDLRTVDLGSVVTDVCESLKMRAREKKIALRSEVGSGFLVSADPVRLKQVIVNLLGNSLKYTKEGEIRIRAERREKNITLRVSDTGIGISAEEQHKLFGKFYRVAGEEVRNQVGTGLGLWITKQLVERMGGGISVESIKGVGTHFVVILPRAQSHLMSA